MYLHTSPRDSRTPIIDADNNNNNHYYYYYLLPRNRGVEVRAFRGGGPARTHPDHFEPSLYCCLFLNADVRVKKAREVDDRSAGRSKSYRRMEKILGVGFDRRLRFLNWIIIIGEKSMGEEGKGGMMKGEN